MKFGITKFGICWVFLLAIMFSCVNTYSADEDLVLRDFPDARPIFRSRETTTEYWLALGSYKKNDGIWQAERQQHLSGLLTRVTLELPSNYSAQDGFEFYQEQLKSLNYRVLFSCRARDCGTSNTWANNHFKIIQLYGLDQYQFYGAYEVLTDSTAPFYVTLYAVQRGNKRVYVQLDILHSDKQSKDALITNPATLKDLLLTNGYYVYPGVITDQGTGTPELKITAEQVNNLVTVLHQQAAWRIGLVGHDYHAGTLEQQQKYALNYAEQLQKALIAQGIKTERLQSYGLGSLAPAGRGDLSARVEVVLLPY